MAFLLGAAAVMESLQSDVRDAQICIADIISRVGPVPFTSWKFPDKTASDLDIEDLLDLYSYSDDAEERQVAHIALYELVIDRLLLLLQTMAVYTDGILKVAKSDCNSKQGTSTSVGLVVKKYWARLTQIHSVVKQTVHEKNELGRKVSDLEGDVTRLNLELKQSYNKNRPQTAGLGSLIPRNRAEMVTGLSLDPSQLQQFGLLAKDEYNKSCQTSETAFTPCTSCSLVQKSFRQSGDMIVNICQQQQIPSCLQKFRPHVSHLDWLSGTDVSRWANEQNKDLQRISKLTATIQPLKDELSEFNTKCEKLGKRITSFDHDMKREKDERTMLHKNYEFRMKELESQSSKALDLERQQRELLYHNKEELERVLEKHKSDLDVKQTLLKEMESTKSKLEDELSSNKTNISEVQCLERDMSGLQEKLDDASAKMDQSARDFQREQARNKSATKHSQALQSKQDALLQRVDALDQENVELRDQVSVLEEEKDVFEDSLREVKRETTPLQKQLKEKEIEIEHVKADKESLEQTISTLETSLETMKERLIEAQERERLIVEYPDINGPVNPDLTGTGDIAVDMDNQVKANNIRIELLEKQNEGLRNSITKLLTLQRPPPQDTGQGQWATYVQTTPPQPLWNPNYHKQHQEQTKPPAKMNNLVYHTNNDNQPTYKPHHETYNQSKKTELRTKSQPGVQVFEFDESSVKKDTKQSSPVNERPAFGHRPLTGNKSKRSGEEFVVGKTSRPNTGSSSRTRPSSGKSFMAPVNASSISAYLQMKKAGKLNLNTNSSPSGVRSTPSRPPTIPTADPEYSHQDSYTCENCDKMYTRHRDLEIHKSYCTG